VEFTPETFIHDPYYFNCYAALVNICGTQIGAPAANALFSFIQSTYTFIFRMVTFSIRA
jgi:hypothetical protein